MIEKGPVKSKMVNILMLDIASKNAFFLFIL